MVESIQLAELSNILRSHLSTGQKGSRIQRHSQGSNKPKRSRQDFPDFPLTDLEILDYQDILLESSTCTKSSSDTAQANSKPLGKSLEVENKKKQKKTRKLIVEARQKLQKDNRKTLYKLLLSQEKDKDKEKALSEENQALCYFFLNEMYSVGDDDNKEKKKELLQNAEKRLEKILANNMTDLTEKMKDKKPEELLQILGKSDAKNKFTRNILLSVKLELAELSIFTINGSEKILVPPSEILAPIEEMFKDHKNWHIFQIIFYIRCSKIWFTMETVSYLTYIEGKLLQSVNSHTENYSWILRIELARLEKEILNITLSPETANVKKELFAEYEERILRLAVRSPSEYFSYLYFLAQFELLRYCCTREAPNLGYILDFHFNPKSGDKIDGVKKGLLFSIFKGDKALKQSFLEMKANLALINSDKINFDRTMAKIDQLPLSKPTEHTIREYWKWMWSSLRVPGILAMNFISDRILLQPEPTVDMKDSLFFRTGSHLMLYRLRRQLRMLNDIGGFPKQLNEEED